MKEETETHTLIKINNPAYKQVIKIITNRQLWQDLNQNHFVYREGGSIKQHVIKIQTPPPKKNYFGIDVMHARKCLGAKNHSAFGSKLGPTEYKRDLIQARSKGQNKGKSQSTPRLMFGT
ncbi:hypothetical protein XELAEV_18023648mg [Xenopus laevis]|uniref:Uncharacterized protein n=1 Tax=Xenopus laevis TaxID=8355 RepID=A0A974D6G4_XENLA|nr:hypothetical protein XELAEV_18023648mg [Xenopus laevis]